MAATTKVKRTFGRLVDDPMLEDYSLRYAPSTYRRWSEYVVATAALGGIAYLADFAIGAAIAITYGFGSALVAVLLAATVIFLTSWPIAYYSAKYSIDMDLLTRGAGFGYFGSTLTSLIYASFTFIFFALEGSIMAQALDRGLGIPLARLSALRAGDHPVGRVRHDAAERVAGVDAADLAGAHAASADRDP